MMLWCFQNDKPIEDIIETLTSNETTRSRLASINQLLSNRAGSNAYDAQDAPTLPQQLMMNLNEQVLGPKVPLKTRLMMLRTMTDMTTPSADNSLFVGLMRRMMTKYILDDDDTMLPLEVVHSTIMESFMSKRKDSKAKHDLVAVMLRHFQRTANQAMFRMLLSKTVRHALAMSMNFHSDAMIFNFLSNHALAHSFPAIKADVTRLLLDMAIDDMQEEMSDVTATITRNLVMIKASSPGINQYSQELHELLVRHAMTRIYKMRANCPLSTLILSYIMSSENELYPHEFLLKHHLASSEKNQMDNLMSVVGSMVKERMTSQLQRAFTQPNASPELVQLVKGVIESR